MHRLRVGFLSSQNYLERTSWSGILYCMHEALRARDLQVVNFGNPRKHTRWRSLLSRVWKKENASKIGSSSYIAEHKQFAFQIQNQPNKMPCDVLFAPVAKRELTFLETDYPHN